MALNRIWKGCNELKTRAKSTGIDACTDSQGEGARREDQVKIAFNIAHLCQRAELQDLGDRGVAGRDDAVLRRVVRVAVAVRGMPASSSAAELLTSAPWPESNS